MRVLLTNNSLDVRAGSELYVRDVAVELLRRGHRPVAYSTRLGQVARELRDATVPVISRLELLAEPPDIIHGHHHYETLSAMLHFPETPAISYCHGWLPWEEAPLRFPRILRYVAVDEVCRERLIAEGGIEPGKIRLLLNFFDASLFPERGPLPRKPLTALAFSNLFSESSDLPVLREACRRHGIELNAAGIAAGNAQRNTGALLAQYDVVFAKARAAIEALAVGASVVLCNPGRIGSLVTTKNFSALRQLNFGIRTLNRPLDVDALTLELHSYHAADAMEVRRTVRESCELTPAVDRIVSLYEEVIAEARLSPPAVSVAADRAVTRYLEESAPRYKQSELELDRNRWATRCLTAEAALARIAGQPHLEVGPWTYPVAPFAPAQHRAAVADPADFDLLSATQFNLLTALGLRDYHFTLEMGCGPLGAARLLIPYLLPERYFAIEPQQSMLKEGLQLELGQDQIVLKKPRFLTGADSHLTSFGTKFDFILAGPTFRNVSVNQLELLLQEAAACLQTDGVLAVSGVESTLCPMAAAAGLRYKIVDWPHPSGETWVLFHLAGSAVPEDPTYRFERPSLSHLSGLQIVHGNHPGFIEKVVNLEESLIVEGWAINPETHLPATHVVFADAEGRVLSTARVEIPRSDVALVHGERALNSGFKARIPRPRVAEANSSEPAPAVLPGLCCLSVTTGVRKAYVFQHAWDQVEPAAKIYHS